MYHYIEFATLLNKHLANQKRSIYWLAKQLKVTPNAASGWLSGETRPDSAELVDRIADVLGIYDSKERQRLLFAAGYGDQGRINASHQTDIRDSNVSAIHTGRGNIYISGSGQPLPSQMGSKLTWEQLRDICADITLSRMAAVQEKYQPDLYLPRNEVRQAFERFLHSSKHGFVLIGSSGVGKSNFLLALREELHSSRPDICVLMYDGGGLKGKPPISGVISEDFDDLFMSDERRIREVWREINQVEGINERQVVFIVDAINESAQAKELLEQLNELVQKPWPWLKVVFSSRPETWQAIKRHVRLAGALYYREEADQSSISQPFSYSVQMEAFSTQEFRSAYANYQRAFNLQTEYEQLGAELQALLRDPFNLWLVAETYEGQSMPHKLEAKQLIGKYVQTLLRDRVLQREELQWLDEQLIPQMLEEGQESVSATLVRSAAAKLLDAKILVRHAGEQRLVFRHERFYEYFVSQYLSNEYKKSEDKAAFFAEWGLRIQGNLLLWDMLRDLLARFFEALRLRGRSEEYFTIKKLGDTTNDYQAQLIVSVLTEHYSKQQSALRPVLSTWLNDSTYEGTLAPRITATIAMSCLIEELLAEMLVHPIKEVRYLVIQEIHTLWQKNPQLTKKLLEGLANSVGMKEVVRFAGPQALLQRMKRFWRAFYSLFGLNDPNDENIQEIPDTFNTLIYASLLLLLDDYTHIGAETEAIQVVREIWRPILNSWLFVSQSRFIENGLKPLRRKIIRQLIDHFVNLIKGVERERFTFSFEDSQAFFPPSPSQKRVLARLIAHFDAGVGQAPESVEALSTYIEAVARQGDHNMFILCAAMIAFIAHIKANPLRTAHALDKVLKKLAQQHPPTKKVDQPTGSIWYLMLTYPFMNLSYVDLMHKEPAQAKEILEIYTKIVHTREITYRNSWRFECGATTRLNGLESTLFGYAVGVPAAGPELLEELVRFYVDNDDHEQIKWSIFQLSLGMARYELPTEGRKAIIDFIQLLWYSGYLGRLDLTQKAQFWRQSAEDLIKQAGSYREQLIELLEKFEQSGGLPETFKVRIRNANWKESTKLVTREAIIWTLSKGLEDKSPGVRNFIKWFFQTASEMDTIEELLLEVAIYLIDFIYDGESLFGSR